MPENICNFKFQDKRRRFCFGGGATEVIHGKKCSIRYEEVITIENLLEAWNDFICGKRKREDVNQFALYLSENLLDLLYYLKNESYIHGSYQEYVICDPKKRIIHKASVRDRVVHRLLYNVLYSYFDRRYIYDSYSCRIGKGTHKAQERFRSFVDSVSKNYTKSCYILKFDIKKCFQSINIEILKKILKRHIEDNKLLTLVEKIINSFGNGLPLGNLTSQLFINIYLNELDYYVKHICKIKYYLRYADDIIIISSSREELENLYLELEKFLKQELYLTTHKKVISTIYTDIDVLGLVFFSRYERLRRSTEKRRKIQEAGFRNLEANS